MTNSAAMVSVVLYSSPAVVEYKTSAGCHMAQNFVPAVADLHAGRHRLETHCEQWNVWQGFIDTHSSILEPLKADLAL